MIGALHRFVVPYVGSPASPQIPEQVRESAVYTGLLDLSRRFHWRLCTLLMAG